MSHSQLSPPNRLLPHPPQPHPLPRPPLPNPPQQDSSRRIQIQLLPPHPHPLFWELTHPQESLQPQFVAVRSLILFASKGLFMLYSMQGGLSMFPTGRGNIVTFHGLAVQSNKIFPVWGVQGRFTLA